MCHPADDEPCSLAKIYTGLCECCAKPVEDCKRTGGDKGPSVLRNRFAALKVGRTEACSAPEAPLPSHDRDEKSAGESDLVLRRGDDTPQLIDDILGDTIDILKELQVHVFRTAISLHTDGIFPGDERVAASDKGGMGAG